MRHPASKRGVLDPDGIAHIQTPDASGFPLAMFYQICDVVLPSSERVVPWSVTAAFNDGAHRLLSVRVGTAGPGGATVRWIALTLRWQMNRHRSFHPPQRQNSRQVTVPIT